MSLAGFVNKQNPLFDAEDDVDAVTQAGLQVAVTQRKEGQAEVQYAITISSGHYYVGFSAAVLSRVPRLWEAEMPVLRRIVLVSTWDVCHA